MASIKDKLLVLVLTAALLSGGLLHAAFEHDHGHNHDGEVSSIWSTLHSSLRHEDKQLVAAAFETINLIDHGDILATASVSITFFILHLIALRRDPIARRALRRGIYRYRRFT